MISTCSTFWPVVGLVVIALIGALAEHQRYLRVRRERDDIARELRNTDIELSAALRLMRAALRKEVRSGTR